MDGERRAIRAYREAIELDPNFAAAYASLARAQFAEADETSDHAGYERAMVSAEKAVALAPEEAEGYRARGVVRDVNWDWPGETADVEKALQLAPGESDSHLAYGWLLLDLGHMREALREAKKAADLDPLSDRAWSLLTYSFGIVNVSHEFSAAHEANRRALEISPEDPYLHYQLGILLLREGRYPEAIAAYRGVSIDLFAYAVWRWPNTLLGTPGSRSRRLKS